MATIFSLLHDDPDHPIWSHLSVAERKKLIDEDLSAGWSVPGVLISEIAIGLMLGIVAVLLSLYW